MGLRKNFIYNTIYQIFIIILPIVTVPYISRVLGANGVGKYSYTSAYSQYFILLGMLGISLYGRRQIAYVKGDLKNLSKEFWSIYILQFISTSISLVLYIIIFVIINNKNRNLYLAQSILILANTFDISWLFIGYEDMESIVIRNSIVKIIGVVLVFLLVKDSTDVVLYALIISITTLIGQLIMWSNIKKIIKFYKPKSNEVLYHLKPSLSLFVSQLAIYIYALLDRTMLGLTTNTYQVGLYENSQKTIKLVLTLVTSLGTVMLPRMSSLYSKGDIKKFKEMIYKAFTFINLLSFPMITGLIAISDNFSLWFYGDKFIGISILLKFGSLMILAISWSNILGMQVMIPMEKEKQFTVSVAIGAIINVILNILLITNLKSIGATISSVIAEFTVTIIQLYYLREIIDIKKILNNTYKPIIGAISMYLVIITIPNSVASGFILTMIQIIIGIITYIVIMILLKCELLIDILLQIKNKVLKREIYNEKI